MSLRLGLVIPNYNSLPTIGETIESILVQENLDILSGIYLADDGSTDSSVVLAESLFNRKKDLSILQRDANIGQWGNLNSALLHLRDEGFDWVFILHSDDLAKKHWLKTMFNKIRDNPSNIVTISSSWDNLAPNGTITKGEDTDIDELFVTKGAIETVKSTLFRGCWWKISGCAIRLEAVETIGLFDEKYSYNADYDWLLRVLNSGYSVGYIPKTLSVYRHHTQSVSSYSFRNNLDVLQTVDIHSKYRHLLSKSEHTRLYVAQMQILLRRSLRAIITGDLERVHTSVQSTIQLIRCLGR